MVGKKRAVQEPPEVAQGQDKREDNGCRGNFGFSVM